jgi:hypothetical protein
MLIRATAAALLLLATQTSEAALFDRGGGLIYDSVLDITWLQDADYAKTSGYDADGELSWAESKTWAAGLVYAGFSDWRLPSIAPVNGTSFQFGGSYDGSTDGGYNNSGSNNELGHLYYSTLANIGAFTTSGVATSCNVSGLCWTNFGPFQNLTTSYTGWYGQPFTAFASYAWIFGSGSGYQTGINDNQFAHAWAVHPGDIGAPVPEPGPSLLLLAGLGLLAAHRHRRR